jgi:RND family efflux transporter MFP subunit
MSAKTKLIKILLPFLILIAGGGSMALLIQSRPAPVKEQRQEIGALVRVVALNREDRPVMVHGTGTVQAKQQAGIAPQVSGRVTFLAPNLVAGGFFAKGEILLGIEDVDYRLAVERAQAAISQAEYDLAREEGNARVARQEWERLALDDGKEPNPLVLYEPQLKNARANLASAKAALEQAKLDLKRTKVRAPFDCIIRSEEVDLGQYVRAGNQIAVVSGTRTAEVVVPLPLEEVAWLQIPDPAGKSAGSEAVVSRDLGGREYEWTGRVVRSLGDIDPTSRMARLVVAVDDPYNLKKGAPADQPALAMGMFVEVALSGKPLSGVIVIPRSALHENDQVWIMGDDGRLRMRQVDVLRIERNEVVVHKGLQQGERLVLTNLSGAAEGMRLRALEAQEASS